MQIAKISVHNFRGIKSADILLPKHAVLVGDNNIGKSTILEAIDLVLGPERLNRFPPVDEHDFYVGNYIPTETNPVAIKVELIITNLSDEQQRHFAAHIEWWNDEVKTLLDEPPAEGTEHPFVVAALRVGFSGEYDAEEDNFVGKTYFLSPEGENGNHDAFKTKDKRLCGFLFLRTLRTGSRALSLERGSLLDVILQIQEKRLTMWEDILGELRKLAVADKPEIGLTEILENVQKAVQAFVPTEWAQNPHLRVSDLTREHLRKTLTVFMGTGEMKADGTEYAAPFQHQGTGTINMLVLGLLSMIAELKQSVIFAMEEPEIAIPPHTQRRIVDSIKGLSAQALFTSHSPYVIDEFPPEQVILLGRTNGAITSTSATLPPAVKAKAYRSEIRTRFCECILARRVLIVEGRTEYSALPVVARRLHELEPERFKTLENLGVAVISAESDSQIAPLAGYFKGFGKTVFGMYDQQTEPAKTAIQTALDHAFELPVTSFEKLVLAQTADSGLRKFAATLLSDGRWPAHLAQDRPVPTVTLAALKESLRKFLEHSKGEGEAASLLAGCTVAEMPAFLVQTLEAIQTQILPPPATAPPQVPTTSSTPAPAAASAVAAPPRRRRVP